MGFPSYPWIPIVGKVARAQFLSDPPDLVAWETLRKLRLDCAGHTTTSLRDNFHAGVIGVIWGMKLRGKNLIFLIFDFFAPQNPLWLPGSTVSHFNQFPKRPNFGWPQGFQKAPKNGPSRAHGMGVASSEPGPRALQETMDQGPWTGSRTRTRDPGTRALAPGPGPRIRDQGPWPRTRAIRLGPGPGTRTGASGS